MKPTLEEVQDNYKRVLLRLSSGELAGIVERRDVFDVYRRERWIDRTISTVDLFSAYERNCCTSQYNIDAIAFMVDEKQVDDFIRNDEHDIEWDWDIKNPHKLKFAIGDVVKICDTEGRPYYRTMVGKVGTVVDANYERLVDDERITYRVRVDNNPNEYQEKGLWVFHEEKSLELWNVRGDDRLDAMTYSLAHTRYSMIEIDDIIKGETNNMDNIVEIYKDRKCEKIDKKYKDLRESVRNTDPRYKIFKECVDTLDKLYKEDKVVTPCYNDIQLSEETTKKLIQLDECRIEECEKLHKFVYEVIAQLQMCETYDQKMNILKTYKIVKENGRVNA